MITLVEENGGKMEERKSKIEFPQNTKLISLFFIA